MMDHCTRCSCFTFTEPKKQHWTALDQRVLNIYINYYTDEVLHDSLEESPLKLAIDPFSVSVLNLSFFLLKLRFFAIRDLFVLFLPVVASVELRKSSENSWLCHSFTSHSLCPFAPYHGLVLSFLFCCRDLQWRVPWGMNRQGLKHFHGGVFLDNGLAVCSLDLVY